MFIYITLQRADFSVPRLALAFPDEFPDQLIRFNTRSACASSAPVPLDCAVDRRYNTPIPRLNPRADRDKNLADFSMPGSPGNS